ncbi:MAG TPA: DUF3427 domain-containing protein [Gammaproteobacteria bacterium]|nr:DUF3427 domain-containing protein [Gammaproteobacteria bacterium]
MPQCLTTGGDYNHFLPHILAEIHKASEIELAVAFIKSSGLELIFQALTDAVTIRHAKLTILTSDYLDVTDPQALRKLMLLAERGADIRIFQSGRSKSFHLKAYIFMRNQNSEILGGSAFIGSSNLSKTALTDGIEWNYKINISDAVSEQGVNCFQEIRHEYQLLIANPSVTVLDYGWITAYENRRKVQLFPVAPGSNDPELPMPEPNEVQREALQALADTRAAGFQRGLVVMATGLGKTYLAAFDASIVGSGRVLFVAHREEILLQAEASFQRILRKKTIGRYSGKEKETKADLLFASVQTLGKTQHLEKFSPDHFDYLVVDEFHHAAASTYRQLLAHFQPRFLLGLTATPERTDQSDILSLCDDNLVFTRDLFHGVENGFLCPFSYFGIYDESVNYEEIPWRNGRFDPQSLSHKLATLGRARHVLKEWRRRAQARTLAFCVSKTHAQFMAERFQKEGVKAAAVYGGSEMNRSEALALLQQGSLEVIFSVDLFNEGVDLPAIDTVLMLRPTESKVLFMQQLGRGLRTNENKERLVVLDFIGNHQGFLNKPQALFGIRSTHQELVDFGRKVQEGRLELPAGCYVNYDLEIIDFLLGLAGNGPSNDYRVLKASLGRRPTLTEFYRSGASLKRVRLQYGSWWQFVQDENDLSEEEANVLRAHDAFFREVEITSMTKSFKAVLLESLLENDGFREPPTLKVLAKNALSVFRRRRGFISDIKQELRDLDNVDEKKWLSYWKGNPVNAWIGGNKVKKKSPWFEIVNGCFKPAFSIDTDSLTVFQTMLQELLDYRFTIYEPRLQKPDVSQLPQLDPEHSRIELPYFPDLRIACGHFRESSAEVDETRAIGQGYGRIDPAHHFIARAIGDSMNGGKHPVHDGDYLLLERLAPTRAGSITGATLVIERENVSGDDQYLLRVVTKSVDGHYILKATNPDYPDYKADESMRTLARLRAVLDPLELALGQEFMREEIANLFSEEFNPGNWNSGHVVLNDKKVHVLLVTLNKQGKGKDHRYHDYFVDERHFHWQSQNSTTPQNKRGRELIEHERLGIDVHLFVREHKLRMKKAAPFRYYGPVHYQKHEGSGPVSVVWTLGQ